MALRIRVSGRIVCAAQSDPEPGDCYLDDVIHARLAGAEANSLHVLVTNDDGETWKFDTCEAERDTWREYAQALEASILVERVAGKMGVCKDVDARLAAAKAATRK